MRERFSNRQLVTIVVAICATAVLMPVTVMAATGTLVNITDAVDASRKARVTKGGTLTVETRAGSRSGFKSGTQTRLGLGYVNLALATFPNELAITELTFAARGPASDTAQEVLIEAFVRNSGSSGCTGPGTPGYTRLTLRRVLVKNQTSTLQLNFNGPPLYLPHGAAGQPTCFGFTVVTVPAGSAMDVGFTGYSFAA